MSPGRRVLVTGAASGLGQDLARRLLARGELVLATDIATDGLAEFPHTLALDVGDADHWEMAFAEMALRYEGVDALVHVAGVIEPCRVVDLDEADINRQIQVNLLGPMLGLRAAARHMGRGGHVVLVNSLTGLVPSPGLTVYSATKFGARGFALGAAQELAEQGIDLTVVYPDGMNTPMGRYEAGFEAAALTFSGRLLEVEEVSAAVLQALAQRPLEVTVPRGRGWLSRLGGLLPGLAARVTPLLMRRGLARQGSWR